MSRTKSGTNPEKLYYQVRATPVIDLRHHVCPQDHGSHGRGKRYKVKGTHANELMARIVRPRILYEEFLNYLKLLDIA
jgi:hypothetical protein